MISIIKDPPKPKLIFQMIMMILWLRLWPFKCYLQNLSIYYLNFVEILNKFMSFMLNASKTTLIWRDILMAYQLLFITHSLHHDFLHHQHQYLILQNDKSSLFVEITIMIKYVLVWPPTDSHFFLTISYFESLSYK